MNASLPSLPTAIWKGRYKTHWATTINSSNHHDGIIFKVLTGFDSSYGRVGVSSVKGTSGSLTRKAQDSLRQIPEKMPMGASHKEEDYN